MNKGVKYEPSINTMVSSLKENLCLQIQRQVKMRTLSFHGLLLNLIYLDAIHRYVKVPLSPCPLPPASPPLSRSPVGPW